MSLYQTQKLNIWKWIVNVLLDFLKPHPVAVRSSSGDQARVTLHKVFRGVLPKDYSGNVIPYADSQDCKPSRLHYETCSAQSFPNRFCDLKEIV